MQGLTLCRQEKGPRGASYDIPQGYIYLTGLRPSEINDKPRSQPGLCSSITVANFLPYPVQICPFLVL